MSHSDHHHSSVGELRAEEAHTDNPHVRHIVIGALDAVGSVAGVWATLAAHARTRGWAAVIAVICLLAAIITWLAAMSLTLSKSGRHLEDWPESLFPHP